MNSCRKRSWKFYLIYMPVPYQEWVSRCRHSTEKDRDEACLLPALTARVLLPLWAAQPRTPVLTQGGTWNHILFSKYALSAGPETSLNIHELSKLIVLSVPTHCSPINMYCAPTYHVPDPLLGSGYAAVNKTRDLHGAYSLINRADTGQVINNINLTWCRVPWDPGGWKPWRI